MSSVETVSLGVWVAVGTRHEPAQINGVAHLLEHMAFKGTARRSALEIASEIEAVGGGKHLRFRVSQGGADAGSAIAFGFGARCDRLRAGGSHDIAFELRANRWNGVASPQLRVCQLYDTPEGYPHARRELAVQWRCGEQDRSEQAQAVFAELELADGSRRNLLESAHFRELLAHQPQ